MSPTLSRYYLSVFAACALLAVVVVPASAEEGRQGRLVSVGWLQKNLGDVVLLDASFMRQRTDEHIPGAIVANNYGGQEPSRATMEQRIQSWGVGPGKKIVIYDKGGDWSAPRLFHDLYYYGVSADELFILDGGLAQWQAKGGAITKEATPPPPIGSFRIAQLRDEIRVRLPEFLVASGDKSNHALVDALEAAYYFGENKFFTRAGHVPNAISMPSTDFFNADKTFKSPAEIQRMATYLGLVPGQVVHSHCGGGGAAAVPWFALQFMAGYPKVKMYWESHREWLRDDRGLPFWTYNSPQLQRDSAWLDGWNAPMLRAFGAAQINIVDVRSAQRYADGHIPYALNIPAEHFRKHLEQPAQLAELLGPAGVNPAHEVILVAESGLTPEAALAFMAFEQLGHAKVSVLMDSVDEWGSRGHKLSTAPTIVGKPKSAQDIAVPVANYLSQPHAQILIRDAKTSSSAYPKVYVDSGKTMSARTPEGKVLRLSYTELINHDGTPKAAKDLWQLISKAGLPRQAQVILYADDPAEAAVSYYLFRLMGWPDIKVWIN